MHYIADQFIQGTLSYLLSGLGETVIATNFFFCARNDVRKNVSTICSFQLSFNGAEIILRRLKQGTSENSIYVDSATKNLLNIYDPNIETNSWLARNRPIVPSIVAMMVRRSVFLDLGRTISLRACSIPAATLFWYPLFQTVIQRISEDVLFSGTKIGGCRVVFMQCDSNYFCFILILLKFHDIQTTTT